MRAGMVRRAADYRWSSAASHLTGQDESGILDMEWRRREPAADWEQVLNADSLESDPRQAGAALMRGGRLGTRILSARWRKDSVTIGLAEVPRKRL